MLYVLYTEMQAFRNWWGQEGKGNLPVLEDKWLKTLYLLLYFAFADLFWLKIVLG